MKKNARWLLLVVVVLVGVSLLIPGSKAQRSRASAPSSSWPGSDLLFKSDPDLSASHLFLPDQGSAPSAVGDVTVRSGNEGATAGLQTFTLVYETYTSTDCTTGASGQTQVAGVNSSTGTTIPKPAAANSIKLTAPNQDNTDPVLLSDMSSHWIQWTSPDGAVPPGESFHNQRICVPYSAVPATRTFVARFTPGFITRAASGGVCGAATAKTLFNLGEQVCVQFFFNPAQVSGGFLNAQIVSPGYPSSCVRHTTSPNVTVDGDTRATFTLPATDTDSVCGGTVSDNRGTWTLNLLDSGGNHGGGVFRVHNPAAGHEAVDLSVNKSPVGGGGTPVNCGANFTWNILVQNQGPDAAQNATLVDSLSTATTFQSISAPGWSCSTPAVGASGLISCTNPSLPAGPLGGSPVVSTITVMAQVVPSIPRFLLIGNGAMVSSLTFDLRNQDNISDLSPGNGPATTNTGCVVGPAIVRSSGTNIPELVNESCGTAPRNGVVDPGELVTMKFCVQNNGFGATPGGVTAPLTGTLRATGGITNPEAGPKTFSPTPPIGIASEGCATFQFRAANVRCGSNLEATIDFADGAHANLGSVNYPIQTGAGGGSTPFVCCSAPTAAMGTVTGTITDGGMPVSGAVVKLSGSQNRTFITDASGTYRFDDVETNGFYTVTPSRANYTFNPSDQSFSQTGNSTNASFTATRNAVPGINDIDTPGYFVRQHYLDFLRREPDEAGFNFWTDQMLQCGSDAECFERRRINVSAAYFLSIEFTQTGGLVDRLYRASYERRPLFNEFTPDSRLIAHDVRVGYGDWAAQLEANKRAFVDTWVQRPDFRATYDGLSNEQYVNALVAHTGVNFSPTEKAALVGRLTAGSATRADVLRQIAEDDRFAAARRNEAFVMMQYFGYLGRDPDEGGYQFWLNKLNQFNGNFEQAEMVKAFLVSGEYRARFAQ